MNSTHTMLISTPILIQIKVTGDVSLSTHTAELIEIILQIILHISPFIKNQNNRFLKLSI
jgi:ABC-type uncharacterized transport system permease subunit